MLRPGMVLGGVGAAVLLISAVEGSVITSHVRGKADRLQVTAPTVVTPPRIISAVPVELGPGVHGLRDDMGRVVMKIDPAAATTTVAKGIYPVMPGD